MRKPVTTEVVPVGGFQLVLTLKSQPSFVSLM